MSEAARVVAVVVTWNRKELLARNLRAVLAQTRPVDEILVVDNASTDGTGESLANEFPTVRVVRLAGNAGAAGGMHVGVREGLALGADWLWLMDDDGVPAPDCLAEQLRIAQRENYALCGPVVRAIEQSDLFAFPWPGRAPPRSVTAFRQANGLDAYATAKPPLWNGTLLYADAARSYGLPKYEMFIWGEDNEYCERLHAAGLSAGIAIRADYFHPDQRDRGWWLIHVRVFSLHLRVCLMCDLCSPRFPIHSRNLGFRVWKYHGALATIFVAALAMCRIAIRGGFAKAARFLSYYWDGVSDRFSREPSRSALGCNLAIVSPQTK